MSSHLRGNVYGWANIVTGWLLLPLCAFFLGIRLWSRRLKRQSLELNDWFAVAIMVCNVVLVIHTTVVVLALGLGQDKSVIGLEDSRGLYKALIGLQPEWALANASVKLSILHLYTKIFVQKWFIRASYLVMALAVLYGLAAFLQIFLSCFPMAFMWDPQGNPGGFCINAGSAWFAVGFVNLVEDILIIVLPLPVVLQLQMDTRKKLSITGIFSLGLIITIISAIRLKVIFDFDDNNPARGLGSIVYWSILEPLLGLINCCLPVIKPAIVVMFGSRRSSDGQKPVSSKWTSALSRRADKRRSRFFKQKSLYSLSSIDEMTVRGREEEDLGGGYFGSQDLGKGGHPLEIVVRHEIRVSSDRKPEAYELA